MKENTQFVAAASEAIVECLSEFPSVGLEVGPCELAKGGACFKLPKLNEAGFNVQLEVFDYGVYPHAEGWHGAPWDVTIWKLPDLRTSLQEFIRSVLSPVGFLEVHYSNGKAYKYILHHVFEGNLVADETGLLFYNWLGRRSQRRFVNDVPHAA